ncbi:GTPase-associated protein 1-related protein [Streptomyces sp. NPDC020807]|uniref:GTPase-associated protein 1-related protein n=1 Tax=Streptomyces sp. NPDC020807 TaxID=3155119 RepID=UPI0033E8F225
MNLPQMHYTSAPPGPDGSGFRFTAVSPGVPSSVLREAEQLVGYEPPRDAPSRPTDEELSLFPAMFSYTRLSDGSGLLSRTVYTGADYSGRWGNFHAHAVHVTDGDRLPGGRAPIAAWDAPQWADRTPDDRTPPPIESFTSPPFSEIIREVQAFAAAREPWLAPVFADLRRLVETPHSPQIVLAETDTRRIALWVMLANAVLPREASRTLTFTTYTRRPQQARQQIIGVLPEDVRSVAGQPHRYSVHDCSDRTPPAPPVVPDVWARTAAAVWAAGAHELFTEARRVAGPEQFPAGPLAVLALAHGLAVPEDARAEALMWVNDHHGLLPEPTLASFLKAVCVVGPGAPELPSGVLAELLDSLHGHVPALLTAPLTARLVSRAVREEGTALPPLPPGALPEPYRSDLAAESGEALLDTVRDPRTPLPRVHALLRVARALDVGYETLAFDLAKRVHDTLFAAPDAATAEALREILHEWDSLRETVAARLETRAADEPQRVAAVLRETRPVLGDTGNVPHLRMCAAAAERTRGTGASPGPDGDPAWFRERIPEAHRLLRIAGVSHLDHPLVLRTAVALVWDDRTPTAAEAAQLLNENGVGAHLTAGTWDLLVSAAIEAPADDAGAPHLAARLLSAGPDAVSRSVRESLHLLAFVDALETREADATVAQGGWTARVQALSHSAPANVRDRAAAALAQRLLGPDRPSGQLGELARSDDGELMEAYANAARTPVMRDVLRRVPARTADCYVAWTAHVKASPRWDLTRRTLLDEVLRPVVQEMADVELRAVEHAIAELSAGRAAAFQEWSRPTGALRRFFGKRARGSSMPDVAWKGDVQPPPGRKPDRRDRGGR